MRRVLVVAFAVAASVLLATAPAATAAQGDAEVVVGAQHTTFGTGDGEPSPSALTNLSVSGSGSSASVKLSSGPIGTILDFESGSTTPASPWSSWDHQAGGGSFTAEQSTVLDGAWSGQQSTTNDFENWFTQASSTTTSNFSVKLRLSSQSGSKADKYAIYLHQGGRFTQELTPVQFRGDGAIMWDNSSQIGSWSPGTTYALGYQFDWGAGKVTVTLDGSPLTTKSIPGGATGYDYIHAQLVTEGSQGSQTATIDDLSEGTAVASSAQYVGAPMSVDNATRAAVHIDSLSNATADITIQQSIDGGSSWTTAASTTATTPGNMSLALTGSGVWRVRVNVTTTGSNPVFDLSDTSILFTDQAPEVTSASPTGTIHTNSPELSVTVDDETFGTEQGESVSLEWFVDGESRGSTTMSSAGTATFKPSVSNGNHTWSVVATDAHGASTTLGSQTLTVEHFAPTISNATPVDSAQLTARETTFSVTVSDDDVDYDGDTLTATLFVDGGSVGSSSRSSNGTLEVSETIATGGQHTFHWEVTDDYGYSVSTETRTVSIPSEIRIYNESAPTELVDGASVRIQMYVDESGSPEVYVRNTSDGAVNMTGLPASKPFVAVADAEGYSTRRIFVPSLYNSQDLYLLPSNATKVDTIFAIADYTGEFPSEETVLLVQRSLNGSYETVAGDYFGASGQFPTQLAYQERHRLVLMNVETGQRRVLGTYTPLASQTATIRVSPNGRVEQVNMTERATIRPDTGRVPALNGTALQFVVPESGSGSWRVTASTPTATLLNESVASGLTSRSVDLRGHAGETLTVSVSRDGVVVATTEYAISETTATPSLLSSLSSLTAQIPQSNRGAFTGFLALLSTVFVMGAVGGVRASGATGGVTGVLVLAGFAVIGWIGYDLVFVAGVGLVAFGGLRRGL